MNHSPDKINIARSSGRERLHAVGVESAALKADWLMADVLGCPRLELDSLGERRLSAEQQATWLAYLARAQRHEPVQYIMGHTEFMDITVHCDYRALIPRPETEFLVEQALQQPSIRTRPPAEILDVGTGTGCIALAMAQALPTARVTGLDREESALALARENAEHLGLTERVHFVLADLLAGWPAKSADLVLANLPYIPTADCDPLPRDVRDFEPRSALDGGATGLDYLSALVTQARRTLRPEGMLYLEIGAAQGSAVVGLLKQENYRAIELLPDYTGRDRVAKGVNTL